MRDKTQIVELPNFVLGLPESEIKFLCNACLYKQGLEIPSTFHFHNTGACEGGCGTINEVSVPVINAKIADMRLTPAAMEFMKGEIRDMIWKARLSEINTRRMDNFFREKYKNNSAA